METRRPLAAPVRTFRRAWDPGRSGAVGRLGRPEPAVWCSGEQHEPRPRPGDRRRWVDRPAGPA